MKQNICVVIFLLLSTICKAQTFIYPQNDSILTEYNDGKFWAYLNKNDFVVGLSCFEEKDDYGKYYHLDIFIKNLSETPIVFQPDSVHSNLLTKKDDTLKLEVYTNEEYQKKIKRSQAWAMALYGISAHLNLVTIHPWVDGNGRTARLLMNYIQFCYHLFPTKIFKEDREEYILSLRQCQDEETNQPFLSFMAGQLKKSLSLEIERFKASQKKGFCFMF